MTTQSIELAPRMKHPVAIFPEALRALQAVGKVAHNPAVPPRTLLLVEIRASQINGCSVCLDMHTRELRKAGDSDERILGVAAWRDNPAFNAAERTALALTEALTRISDCGEPIPDELWADVTRHYDEAAMATLILNIANINLWNRLNVGVRQVVGAWSA
jgi:AhpD family alkylhydroperoxidase